MRLCGSIVMHASPQTGSTVLGAITWKQPAQPRLPASFSLSFIRRFFGATTAPIMPEMAQRSESLPSSSMRLSSAPAAVDDDDTERDPHIPGSIPPWVHISSSDDDTLLPPPVRPNTRHYKPPPSHYKPGRKWDHIRSAEPPLMSAPIADHQTRWVPFMQSGPHPPWHEQGARLMSPEWMEDNVPITVRGWEEEDEALADKQEELKGFWLLSPEKRERTVRLFWVSPSSLRFFPDKQFSTCLVSLHRCKHAGFLAAVAVLHAGSAEGGHARAQSSRVGVEPAAGQGS